MIAAVAPYENMFRRKIPVIAAGGVFTGEDIFRFLQLGAAGVQMATRFVATDECDADIRFKEAYIHCRKEDIVIIKSPVGMPGRAIRNRFLDAAAAGVRSVNRCAWRCLEHCDIRNAAYCISSALDNARRAVSARKGWASRNRVAGPIGGSSVARLGGKNRTGPRAGR